MKSSLYIPKQAGVFVHCSFISPCSPRVWKNRVVSRPMKHWEPPREKIERIVCWIFNHLERKKRSKILESQVCSFLPDRMYWWWRWWWWWWWWWWPANLFLPDCLLRTPKPYIKNPTTKCPKLASNNASDAKIHCNDMRKNMTPHMRWLTSHMKQEWRNQNDMERIISHGNSQAPAFSPTVNSKLPCICHFTFQNLVICQTPNSTNRLRSAKHTKNAMKAKVQIIGIIIIILRILSFR